MFEKCKSYREMMDVKIIKSTDQEEIKHLQKQRQQYTPSMSYYNADTVFQDLYPNCYKLLYLLMFFPLSVACVNAFLLRNHLSQTTLESLLKIATESPKEGFSDSQYKYFVDELKKNNPKMKMSL